MSYPAESYSRRQFLQLAALTAFNAKLNSSKPVDVPIPEMDSCENLSPEKWNKIRESTVMVNQFQHPHAIRAHEMITRRGSGFYIGNGVFITSRHVLADRPQYGYPTSTTRLLQRTLVGHPEYQYDEVQAVTIFNYADLALAMTCEGHFTSLPITYIRPNILDPAYSCTYQTDTLNVRGTNVIHQVRARFIGTIPMVEQRLKFPQISYLLATDLDPHHAVPRFSSGASGSPIVDAHGRAFAVLRSTLNNPSLAEKRYFASLFNLSPETFRSLAFAVPLASPSIRSTIESHGIHYLP